MTYFRKATNEEVQDYVNYGVGNMTTGMEPYVPIEPDDEDMWCFAHGRTPDKGTHCLYHEYRGECDVALAHMFKAEESNVVPFDREAKMLTVGGRPFRCDCGANVLTQTAPNRYVCNGCNTEYEGS